VLGDARADRDVDVIDPRQAALVRDHHGDRIGRAVLHLNVGVPKRLNQRGRETVTQRRAEERRGRRPEFSPTGSGSSEAYGAPCGTPSSLARDTNLYRP
jgi:hypothetical protein